VAAQNKTGDGKITPQIKKKSKTDSHVSLFVNRSQINTTIPLKKHNFKAINTAAQPIHNQKILKYVRF
jgi:hypothetical protein